MPDPYLHGNGYACPACELRRDAARRRSVFGVGDVSCNHCGGTGRIAFTEREAYEEQLRDAREYYWADKTYG